MRKRINKLVAGLLTAVTLTTTVITPAFAAQKDASIDNKEVKETVVTENQTTGYQFSTDEILDKIAAMEIKDPAKRAKRDLIVKFERGFRQYGMVKRYLMERGPNFAFILGIYYVPSPIMYEVIHLMEIDVKEGNCAYIYNGHYYESPVEDPTFSGDPYCYAH